MYLHLSPIICHIIPPSANCDLSICMYLCTRVSVVTLYPSNQSIFIYHLPISIIYDLSKHQTWLHSIQFIASISVHLLSICIYHNLAFIHLSSIHLSRSCMTHQSPISHLSPINPSVLSSLIYPPSTCISYLSVLSSTHL